jgi:hypothetical protein
VAKAAKQAFSLAPILEPGNWSASSTLLMLLAKTPLEKVFVPASV